MKPSDEGRIYNLIIINIPIKIDIITIMKPHTLYLIIIKHKA